MRYLRYAPLGLLALLAVAVLFAGQWASRPSPAAGETATAVAAGGSQ